MTTAKWSVDDSVRELMLLMPRLVGRAKRLPLPVELQGFDLAPRHLSLLAFLLLDGAGSINELAGRLELAPTTVSLLVAELAEQGVLSRTEDPDDRRRRIVEIDPRHHDSIAAWLEPGARAWRRALEPLSPAERSRFVATLLRYEEGVERPGAGE